MQSGTEAATSNKSAALEQLRLARTQQANHSGYIPSSHPAPAPNPLAYPAPPAQSRDATVASRFFPTTPSSTGNVLVPSSSPLTSDTEQRPYQPYGVQHGYDVAARREADLSRPWAQPRNFYSVDPLSTPSGFVSNGVDAHASLRRSLDTGGQRDGSADDDGPPRKRINLGVAHPARDIANSPPSPEITRPGQRRRVRNPLADGFSTSDDDSLPDVVAGPSKQRITKGRPASPESSPVQDPSNDPKFIRFKVTNPMESPNRIQAAWVQSKGDANRALQLLSDPSWDAPKQLSPVKQLTAEDMGRVKEIDEATKAHRLANKEKGKKSMIYAYRPILEVKSDAAAATTNSKTAPPPSPAVVVAPRRKRLKKMVVDSESEKSYSDSDEGNQGSKRPRSEISNEARALDYFNTAASEALQELTGCTPEQAKAITCLRPFKSVDQLNEKLGQGKKKAGPAGISPRMFEDCQAIFEGYGAVDSILEDCEQIGASLRAAIASWTISGNLSAKEKRKGKGSSTSSLGESDDGSLSLRTISPLKERNSKDYLTTQPSLLSQSVQLKEYQLLGVNWLHLLYRNNLCCILADEMGLGKTIQVISFFALLKERGTAGPHLIVVPSSTLENWCREFARFAPSISVQTYYAGKEERPQLRQTLLDTQKGKSGGGQGWEVLITTYNLAQGDERDRKFFRKINWDCCVYDEGHVLKNFQSQRYQTLLKFNSNWRLLLTGTPLQNNLQELVSLMNFILPHQFADSLASLRAIFKAKGDSNVTLLARERVSRAKKMMTPFVLRRRKDQVLKDLPNKTERIEWCEMTDLQRSIYRDALQRSRKTILEEIPSEGNGESAPSKKKGKANGRAKDKYMENSSNVLMDLRKAASHPMLFRTRFTDDILSGITKQLLKEPDFKKRGALYELVKEDMTVMTDAELQAFCATYKSTRKFLQNQECYLDAGKVQVLMRLLGKYSKEGRKILIFSQFTQILDILQAILKHKSISYLILTGSTQVDVRQSLVDEFTEDPSIPVFLLSTKAGGMGINLTAASVVIMFDQDFNPHNDRQAQDRAYRIGQKRDVDVIKLISQGTIEEDMLRLGMTKLALDEAVAGDSDDKDESVPEREMKISLMNALRQQFEKENGTASREDTT